MKTINLVIDLLIAHRNPIQYSRPWKSNMLVSTAYTDGVREKHGIHAYNLTSRLNDKIIYKPLETRTINFGPICEGQLYDRFNLRPFQNLNKNMTTGSFKRTINLILSTGNASIQINEGHSFSMDEQDI
ncbi:hypothetical protein RF11_12364 [Thelohanellus kitauei]|uniref:Uncharacterized protein n=1 Tax=Thelohanellus kitauei TaxID=669202 RepID=A0A0C2NFV0_THEKT|nr:hypothetical protein RF11_12364 [Thelohanellus kitauei]